MIALTRFLQRALPVAALALVLTIEGCAHSGESASVPSAGGSLAEKTSGRSPLGLKKVAPPVSYSQTILADGPTAYYQLIDASSTLADSGPNNIPGIYGAAVVRGSTPITFGTAAAAIFPGGPTYNPAGFAYTPKNAVFQLPHPTMEAWVSLNAPNATSHDLPILAYGSLGRGVRYGLFVHGLGGGQQALQVQLRDAGQPAFMMLCHRRLAVGQIYHVVVTYDGFNVAAYINGVLDSDWPYAGAIDYSPYFTDGLQIGGTNGALPWAGASFPGAIEQAAIYATPLQQVQVVNHYFAGETVAMMVEKPAQADSFVDSIALNTHFSDSTSIYGAQFASIKALLLATGIRHIRDGITSSPAYVDEMNQLAAGGVFASYVTQLSMTQAQVQQWPGIVGASFEQYEAPNEQDDSGNPNWLPGCIAFQKSLYGWVKNDPQLAKYPVVGPSMVGFTDAEQVGNLSAYLDDGNIHDYFDAFNPGTYGWGNIHPPFGIYGSIPYNVNIGKVVAGTKPIEATETGYGTVAGNPLTLDYRTHLRYMTRMFFEQFNNGIVRSYSYELMDQGGTNVFYNFGLVTTALAPKPAYTGIQSLITQLKDPGAPFTTTPLTYEISGVVDNVAHTLLQKRNGHDVLAIWLEVPDWVTLDNAGGDIIVPPQTATLTTANHFSSATITTMGETGAMSTAQLAWNGQSATISVADTITLIDLAP